MQLINGKILSIKKIKKPKYTYDIEVEDNHNFFANNILVHNCHHMGGFTWREIIDDCINATYRLGFTGTAFRTDTGLFLLRAATDNIIDKVSYYELIKAGILSRLTVYIKDPHCEKIYGDYFMAKNKGIVNNDKRNNLIVKYALNIASKGKTCLILTGNSLKHVWNLEKIFREKGYTKIKHITGNEPLFIRKAIKHDFNEGVIKILIATTVFDEGENVPNMNVLILGLNGRALRGRGIKILQRTGRVLRTSDKKRKAYIIIFKDTHNNILLKHSNETINVLKNENCFKFKNFN